MKKISQKIKKIFADIFKHLDNNIQVMNQSKIFAGLMIIILNIASKFVIIQLPQTVESYLKFTFSRDLLVFAIAWMGTRDIYIALFIMTCFAIVSDLLFNEESIFCILPDEFKDHHLSILEQQENMANVTDEEIIKAKKVLERAKEQKKTEDIELESYKI